MEEETAISHSTEQPNPTIPPSPPSTLERTWWKMDLEASGITEATLKIMGDAAPYPVSDPYTVWFDLLNHPDADDGGPIDPHDIGEVLAFPYLGEEFERDAFHRIDCKMVTFTRVKPRNPRLVGEFREWIERADGTQRKLNARDRRQIEAAEAGEETHGGTPCWGPSGYKCKDNRKPNKYEAPVGQSQRPYDLINIFHKDGLKATDRLYLIEGEKKTICANSNLGLKAYGLPGVTGAHDVEASRGAMDSGMGNYVLHEKIRAHCEQGGEVATLFDSPDVRRNASVICAQAKILRAVQKAGGRPKIGFIPDNTDCKKKRGIDDFYVECSCDSDRVLKALFYCSALPFKSLEDYEKCEMSRFRLQLPQSLSGHAGAWFAHDRQSLKKWVRKAAKAFDVDEEQVMEWCNETARVYQETSQQRIIRDLERHSELLLGKGDLRMDERTQEIYLGKKLLRPDSAVTSVRANLSLVPNRLLGEPTRDDVRDAIRHIAERDRFHPIREYLDGLKPWDGTRRMASAIDHLGVASAARHLLQEVLYKKFLISAVARCYEPGCKVDTMLILHGPQGVRKSSHFKALCADSSWFTDQGFDVNDKDAVLTIGRFWIVEWSELDNLRRSSRREALKGFLTRTVDSVRPPYGRAVIDLRRSCVFGGTTNDDTFLEDSTGLRRFWIISDVEDVDVEWFEKNRDYLWAEAISAYRAGEKWWLDSAQEQLLGELQHRHEVESQWAEVIEDYLTNGIRKKWDGTTEKAPTPESVTVRQVLEAIGKEQSRQTKADQREAADVLRSLGWVKDPSRTRANGRQIIWRKQGTTAVASLAGEGEWKSFLGVNPANCNGTPDLGSIDGTGQRLATVSSEATVEEIEPLPVCCRAGGA